MQSQTSNVSKIESHLSEIAIVGRPNVGKSSLFNRLVQSRASIVQSEKGTTRDRVVQKATWKKRPFFLIDTGGYTWDLKQPFGTEINQEIEKAMKQADIIFFVCDGNSGLHPQDELIADKLRREQKKTFLVVNKLDRIEQFAQADEFHKLGFKHLVKVSALHGLGISDLLDLTTDTLPELEGTSELPPHDFSICIAGEPNSGKSSYFNALLKEDRAIVSDVAGTTRDIIAEMIEYKGKKILLKDTAGIRPTKKIKSSVIQFSVSRAKNAIKHAELVVFLFDGDKGLGGVSKSIGSHILECAKPCVIVVNKWDLVKKFEQSKYMDLFRSRAGFLADFPVVFISAKTGRNILAPLDSAIKTYEKHLSNQKTHALNEFLSNLKKKHKFHEPVRLKFLTQVRTAPPHFLLIGRRIHELTKKSELFIKNQIQEEFDLYGTPIQLSLREESE